MIIEENVEVVNKIESNYEFLSKLFLELLQLKPEFKARFQAIASEIYADIESASTNPNCSCRGKVEHYVNTNREKSAVFLNDFLRDNKYNINLSEIENRYRFVIYNGIVEKVKISEWKEFSDKLLKDRATYRSFSVSRIDDEYVNVFFL